MSSNNQRKILHIDDDEQFTRFVGKRLTREGYQVKALHDPTLALDELSRNEHHAVLLDIEMPQINGLNLLREIKRQDGGLQVIMLTGYIGIGTILQSMRWGAEACFFKPLTHFDPLFETMEMVFRKRDRWWLSLAELAQHRRVESTAEMTLASR